MINPDDAAILALEPNGYWKLDDESGVVAVDATGTSDGTYVNSPTLGVWAPNGRGVLFNGVNQRVTIPKVAGNTPGLAWTLMAKIDASAVGGQVLSSRYLGASPPSFVELGYAASRLGLTHQADGVLNSSTTAVGQFGALAGWHWIGVGRYRDDLFFFVDNTVAGVGAGYFAGRGAPDGATNWAIGDYGEGNHVYYSGAISRVALFTSKGLSPAQVAGLGAARPGKLVYWIGDSLVQAALAAPLAAREGWYSNIAGGVGGTGYTTANPFISRLPALIAANPDIAVIEGGGNDGAASLEMFTTAVNTFWSQLREGLPNATLYATVFHRPPAAGQLAALQAAAASANAIWLDCSGWITGTGYVGAEARDGNADVYIGDGVHMTAAGNAYFGTRLAHHLRPPATGPSW